MSAAVPFQNEISSHGFGELSVVTSQWSCVTLIPGIMDDFQRAVVFFHDACPFHHFIYESNDGSGAHKVLLFLSFRIIEIRGIAIALHAMG